MKNNLKKLISYYKPYKLLFFADMLAPTLKAPPIASTNVSICLGKYLNITGKSESLLPE